jgi:hypothetical protein
MFCSVLTGWLSVVAHLPVIALARRVGGYRSGRPVLTIRRVRGSSSDVMPKVMIDFTFGDNLGQDRKA